MVGIELAEPQPTKRCADWTYHTNDINDGEFATVEAGGILDYAIDTVTDAPGDFNPDPGIMQCNGVSRAIPCCTPCP